MSQEINPDLKHLQVLSIFHYVLGGSMAVFRLPGDYIRTQLQ